MPKDPDGEDIITITVDNAEEYLLSFVKELARMGVIDPFCGICKAQIKTFHCEVGKTKFKSIDEARPHLRSSVQAQRKTADFLKGSKN